MIWAIALFIFNLTPADSQQPEIPPELIQAAHNAAQTRVAAGTDAGRTITISAQDITMIDERAFGMAVLRAGDTHEEPWLMLFLAQFEVSGWRVAYENTVDFAAMLETAPADLMTAEARAQLRQNASGRTSAGDGSSLLSLPYEQGQTWTLTGGPHSCCGSDSTDQGALDLADGLTNGYVRAAREGVVFRSDNCPNFVRVDHSDGWQTGYYHIINEAVSNGQSVARGQFLALQGTGTGCGGFASGPHVHFSLRLNGVIQSFDNRDLGGWTVMAGASQYEGCMRRIRDGLTQCQWGPIYNDGAIGSGIGTPLAPLGTDVVTNGNFSGGFVGWGTAFDTSYAIQNGALNWVGLSGSVAGAVQQVVNYTAPQGSVVQLDFQLGNNSSVEKRVRAHVQHYKDGEGIWDSGVLVCEFTIKPGTALQSYSMRRRINETWTEMRIWIEGYPADGKLAILTDNVQLRRVDEPGVNTTECINPNVPGPITRISPQNSETITTFTSGYNFQWQPREDTVWYHVFISGANGYKLNKWVKGVDVCDVSACTLPYPPLLNNSTYTWWMAGWNPDGLGKYNDSVFIVDVPAPGAVARSAPTDPYTYDPLTWASDIWTTWYYLRFERDGTPLIDEWVKAGDTCNPVTCSVERPLLKNGSYQWTMKAWGPGGFGPEDNIQFTVAEPPPAAVIMLSPSGAVPAGNITLTWEHEPHSLWYRIVIVIPSAANFDQWYSREQAACDTTCSVTVSLPAGDLAWWMAGWGPGGMGTWGSHSLTVQ